jgi:simple sugar transport system permease protein
MSLAFLTRSRGLVPALLAPVLAVLLALVTTGILLLIVGSDPVAAYRSMFDAAFGSPFAIGNTLVKTVPRLLPALGIAVALRAGLWNIGAEGQLYIGAIAATAITLWFPDLGAAGIVLALLAAAFAGGIWGAVPGVLRATRGVNEVITSLMLVYVAILLAGYLVGGPWSVPNSSFPGSETVSAGERLPIIWDKTLLNAGFLIALGALGATWVLVSRTSLGLRLRALGGNVKSAALAGIDVKRTIVVAMLISGAYAGLAGGIEIIGVRGRLIDGFSPGYGFEAIAIALLGGLNPAGILLGALLFGALDAGSAGLETAAPGTTSSIVQVSESLTVIYLLIALGVRDLWIRRRSARAALEDRDRKSGEAAAPGGAQEALG